MANYVRKTLVCNTPNFIIKAKAVHGERFDYSKVDYKAANKKVTVTCKVHGDWDITPTLHLSGTGCRKCAHEASSTIRTKTLDWFIEKANVVHNNFYDYSAAVYVNSKTKVDIICPVHGKFSQTANSHLCGHGCAKCMAIELGNQNRLTREQFICKAEMVHGDIYGYSLVEFIDAKTNVELICKVHGVFKQKPHHHMNGHGCAVCASERAGDLYRKTTQQYILDAIDVHGSTYDYSLVDYRGADGKVKIICREHGVFEQGAQSHLSGRACPACTLQGGFNQILPATLYILRCGNITKVGITNKNAEYRAKYIGASFGESFEIVEEYTHMSGTRVLNVETAVLRKLRALYLSPVERFDGSTECFYDLPLVVLKTLIRIEMDKNEEGEASSFWASKPETTDGVARL